MSVWDKRGGAGGGLNAAAGDPVVLGAYAAWRGDATLTTTDFDWLDRTGHGHTMRQTVAAAKPTVVTVAEANSQLGLRFDGVDDYLASIDAATSWKFTGDGTGVTAWSVWTVRAVAGVCQLFSTLGASSLAAWQLSQNTSGLSTFCSNNAGASVVATALPACLVVGEPTSAFYSYKEGTSPECQGKIARHTYASLDSAIAPATNDPPNTLQIGRRANGTNFLQADLLECALWNTTLTAAQQVALAIYTLNRYGVT